MNNIKIKVDRSTHQKSNKNLCPSFKLDQKSNPEEVAEKKKQWRRAGGWGRTWNKSANKLKPQVLFMIKRKVKGSISIIRKPQGPFIKFKIWILLIITYNLLYLRVNHFAQRDDMGCHLIYVFDITTPTIV